MATQYNLLIPDFIIKLANMATPQFEEFKKEVFTRLNFQWSKDNIWLEDWIGDTEKTLDVFINHHCNSYYGSALFQSISIHKCDSLELIRYVNRCNVDLVAEPVDIDTITNKDKLKNLLIYFIGEYEWKLDKLTPQYNLMKTDLTKYNLMKTDFIIKLANRAKEYNLMITDFKG